MARKRKVPFRGDRTREREAKEVAQQAKRFADAVADLDRVRKWARESRALLTDVLTKFADDFEDDAPYSEEQKQWAARWGFPLGQVSLAELRAVAVGVMLRGSDFDLLSFLDLIGDAAALIGEIEECLPTDASMGGTDYADRVLSRYNNSGLYLTVATKGTLTQEERAIALSTSVDALKKRRQRRR